jgi:fructokinase
MADMTHLTNYFTESFLPFYFFYYLCTHNIMNMRKVIGIGETILDIIFKDDQPIGAVPGGSMFNGLISLGRVGLKTTFISETGDDRVGRNIIQFLKDNHVDASHISVYPETKSPVSLAFLNDQNDAEYIFYKDHPNDKLDFVYPDIQADDIVMFGSYYAVNPVIRPQVQSFLEFAHSRGAILYYDVNFRASHRGEVMKLRATILENLEYADIVRGSSEDFEVMFNMTEAETVYRSQISFYCKNFIYTQGAEPLEVRGVGGLSKQYPVTPMETVSTIGAGDNFNAGFVYGMVKEGITREMLENGLSEEQWNQVINQAQQFSANVCKSIKNSIDLDFAQQKEKELEMVLKDMEENNQ